MRGSVQTSGLGALLLLLACTSPGAGAPRVVKATPDNGDGAVDPATRAVRVTFDQPMDTKAGYSVVGGGPTFPTLAGRPRWEGDRTLVVPVRLKAGHDYWLSINSDRFINCRSAAGEPATPYPIAFRTAAGKAGVPEPDELLGRNREAVAQLRRAVDEDYSYRDLRGVDWDARFKEATPAMERAATGGEFARAAAGLLSHAKDLHVWLKVGDEVIASHRRQGTPNFNPRILPRLVPDLKQHGRTTLTGRFDDGVVYLAIGTWENREPASMDAVYAALKRAVEEHAPAVIVDVRPNSGGDEVLARKLAGCFVTEPKVYSKHTTRRGGEWSPVFERVVEPDQNGPAYRGKVAVLMGPANMSSCESFLRMMKRAPDCVLVGDKSQGSSGNPQPHDLGNGVTVYLSSWKDLAPDGTEAEGKGVDPDLVVKTTAKDFAAGDPVLEAALKRVREAGAK